MNVDPDDDGPTMIDLQYKHEFEILDPDPPDDDDDDDSDDATDVTSGDPDDE